MKRTLSPPLILVALPLAFLAIAAEKPAADAAPYQGWRHSGTLAVLTTPDGADLPATAREEGFPILVRLGKDLFDFSQAKADGADLRFSAEGRPLAYQIEQWDPAAGAACVWVRMPVIRGNARQAVTLYWGKDDAASESNGGAVFNASNGFVTVMHLAPADPVKDEAGTLSPVDAGTTPCAGVIGAGPALRRRQGNRRRGEDQRVAKRQRTEHDGGLVQGRTVERHGRRLGKRAGAGQGPDGFAQSPAPPDGMLLLRRERGGREPLADVAVGACRSCLQEGRFADSIVNGRLDGISRSRVRR